jgi:hypothetical protein
VEWIIKVKKKQAHCDTKSGGSGEGAAQEMEIIVFKM